MRKFQRDGVWYAQRSDGSWLRWNFAVGDWRPSVPPAGEGGSRPEPPNRRPEAAFEPIPERAWADALPPGAPTGLTIAFAAVFTYFRLVLPALIVGGALALLPVFFFFLLFLSSSSPAPVENALAIVVFGAVSSAFLAAGITAADVFARTKGSTHPARWLALGVPPLLGAPIAWVAAGDSWVGTTAGRLGMHALLAAVGLAIELVARSRPLLRRPAGWAWGRGPRPVMRSRDGDVPPDLATAAIAETIAEGQRRTDPVARTPSSDLFDPQPGVQHPF